MKKAAHFRYGILLVTLAFLMNVMLPFFAVYNITDSAKSAFGDKILICTVEGFRWFDTNDIASGKQTPETHKDLKCPLCYAAHSGDFGSSLDEYETVFQPHLSLLKYRLANADGVVNNLSYGLQARAPPVV
jgi:hypothetical protein